MTTKVVKARRAKEKERVKEKEKVKEKEREKVKGRKEKARAKVSGRGEALPCNRSPAKKKNWFGEKMRCARPSGSGVPGHARKAMAVYFRTRSRSSPLMAPSRSLTRPLQMRSGESQKLRLRRKEALNKGRLLCRSFRGLQDTKTTSQILVSSV